MCSLYGEYTTDLTPKNGGTNPNGDGTLLQNVQRSSGAQTVQCVLASMNNDCSMCVHCVHRDNFNFTFIAINAKRATLVLTHGRQSYNKPLVTHLRARTYNSLE